MVETGEEPRRWRWFLPVLLLSTTACKLALVWRFPGFLTGDDTEVVETAAKYAVGLVYRPWEIRSLFHPLVLAAPVVWLGARAGLRDPHWLTFLAATPTVAFSAAGVAIFRRLAAELGANAPAARAATFLFALHWLSVALGA